MNCAVTTRASALQRRLPIVVEIGVTAIYVPPRLLRITTIARTNALSRYTSPEMATTSTSAAPVGAVTLAAGPSKEMLASTSYLLKRLGFEIKSRAYEALEGSDFTPQHHAILSLLDERVCGAQGSIADALGYDRSQLVGLLDELELKGLILRKRDPDDRRRHLVKLTPEGREALGELRAISKAIEKEFFAPLDAEQRKTLHELLFRLASHHDPRVGAVAP